MILSQNFTLKSGLQSSEQFDVSLQIFISLKLIISDLWGEKKAMMTRNWLTISRIETGKTRVSIGLLLPSELWIGPLLHSIDILSQLSQIRVYLWLFDLPLVHHDCMFI